VPAFSDRFIFGLLGSLALLSGLAWLVSSRNHWKATAATNEQLYHSEQAAHAATVANYRAASIQAQTADAANVARVKAQATVTTERTSSEYEARIAAANVQYRRLQQTANAAAANSGRSSSTPVSHVPGTTTSAPKAAKQDGLSASLPASDGLLATEQAIQLDELIKWVVGVEQIDVNGTNAPIVTKDK
jgi:hypothetical protein